MEIEVLNKTELKIVGEGVEAALARVGLIVAIAASGGTSGGTGGDAAFLHLRDLFNRLNSTLIEIEAALLQRRHIKEPDAKAP